MFRGRLHQLGLMLAIPAGIILIAASIGVAAKVTVAIFVTSLAGMLTSSSMYHRWGGSARTHVWLRKVDHAMIYLLIAGTYTPVAWLALPRSWAIGVLALIWGGAIGGIVFKLFVLNDRNAAGSWLYVVLGAGGVLALPKLFGALGGWRISLLLAGGAAYLGGALILYLKRPDPSPRIFGYHEIWHGCTLVGAGFHFALVASLVRSAPYV